MLHTVLLVLKIMGIILAILLVLGIMIFAIPFTYEGKGDFHGEIKGSFVTRSFLSMVYFKLSAIGMDIDYVLRIFGIPILKGTIAEKGEADVMSGDASSDSKQRMDVKNGKKAKAMTEKVTVDKYAGIMDLEELEEEDVAENSESDESVLKKIKKIVKLIRKLPAQIKNLRYKYSEWKKFLTGRRAKIAFYHAKDILQKLYYHIKPNKLEAKLIFGFDSPDKTGQALGILGMVYGTIKIDPEKFQVMPDFDKKVLEGNVYIKGRFVLGYVSALAIRLYFKKEVQYVIKKANRLRGGL